MTQCETPLGRANLRAVRLQFRLDLRSRNPAIPVGAGPVFRAIGGIAIPENLGLCQRVTVPAVTE